MQQAIVVVPRQSKLRAGEVSAKNSHSRLQVLVKPGKIQVQLQCLPEANFGLMSIARADQQIQRRSMLFQKIGGDVCADVSGRPGQEYRHVAPLVPVRTVSASFSALASSKWRGGRASSGLPSIRG